MVVAFAMPKRADTGLAWWWDIMTKMACEEIKIVGFSLGV